MRFPSLVRKNQCNTPITINLNSPDAYGEDGEPIKGFIYSGKCNYQEKTHEIVTADKRRVEVAATCLFHTDICPDIDSLEGGIAIVLGKERKIEYSTKARNPDGTVNFIQLELK